MIHYHGTPIGGQRQNAARLLAGRHALVAYTRPEDIGVVAEVCQSFVLDNGAYPIWRRGGQLDIPGYLDFVRTWHRHPGFDWALIPDSIGGSEEENDELLEAWPADLARDGVPVWHLHESIERLVRLASAWRVVALGSSGAWATPGTKAWRARMDEAMAAICDEQGRPICKLHGLRMLSPRVFTTLPLSSADSTNVARNFDQLDRFGMYVPATGAQRAEVIAGRIEAHNSAPVFMRQAAAAGSAMTPGAQGDIFAALQCTEIGETADE